MTLKVDEIDAKLKARGYKVIHATAKKRAFQLRAGTPVYLNLTSKSGRSALVVHPAINVDKLRDQISDVEVGDEYYHSSNMIAFPKRVHRGENPIPYGWALTFNSTSGFEAAMTCIEGR